MKYNYNREELGIITSFRVMAFHSCLGHFHQLGDSLYALHSDQIIPCISFTKKVHSSIYYLP